MVKHKIRLSELRIGYQWSKNKNHKIKVIMLKVHIIRVLGPSKIKDHKSTKGVIKRR